ncbi:MAG: DUF5104 domain-containing protein [Ruminococcus sp.]|nr:DUF5104 domain-containing protein [Ruminococcus sp.]
MKKVITILMVTIMAFSTLCSCGSGEYKTPTQQAKEMQTEIMKCFENEDKDTLKSFFSEYATDNYDLDSQIDEAFDFIDGKIVSYDEPFGRADGSSERKAYGAETSNIKTDKGTEYSIGFKGWLTNNKDSDEIGVILIGIRNETLMKTATQKEIDENPAKYDINIGEED